MSVPSEQFAAPHAGEPPLSTASDVAGWLAERAPGRLAVDVEADGMFRYRARLCTVQLADARRTAVVDTLAVPAAEALAQVLGDGRVCKVIHDASFDARLLAEQGAPLENLFDTSIAARFLGYRETGLSALLQRCLGVELDKAQQQADWGQRPLSTEALVYLHEDVRYLLALSHDLETELRAQDILAEFEVECDYLLAQARKPEQAPRPPWMRVKGATQLRGPALAVLRELAALREELAQSHDLPPGRLLPGGLLCELAQRRPQSLSQLDRLLRRTRLPAADRQGLLDAIRRGREAGQVPEQELRQWLPETPAPGLRQLHKRRRAALMQLRDEAAAARGVDPQVVLPGHCLKVLTTLPELTPKAIARVEGLGACRVERYGTELLSRLAKVEDP